MATLPRNLSRAALLGVASAVALSSCALPPREAWRKIQDDGLIAYIKYELETPRHGAVPAIAPSSGTPTSPTKSGEMVLAQRNFVQSLKDEQSRTTLTAFSVPALPGYVRSPYTNPPRLVDVRGVPAGTTMVCPYTHRTFIVPGEAGTTAAPKTLIAQESESRVQAPERPALETKKETESPSVALQDKPESTTPTPAPTKPIEDKPMSTPAPNAPTVASTPAPAITPIAPAPSTSAPTAPTPKTPSVAAKTPPTTPTAPVVTAPTPPAPKPVQEIPFGEAIPGRPGFVNSPYAAKHQLVDVTGLPAGMEVKCPYTGKLFRVPMQDMASSKPVETVPPLSSPSSDKPQKK